MDIEWINDILYICEFAAEHAGIGNHMLAVVHWFMAILLVGWTAFLFVILFKFNAKKNPKASYHGITSHFSTHLEVGVVIVEVVLLLGFAFPLWAARSDVDRKPTGDDVVNLRAVGKQFGWMFHYGGGDKMIGMTDPFAISSANGIGLMKDDPNAIDDFISVGELVLPKGRPCIVQVTSIDVIHGLALVPLFSQQDAIPGTEIPMWFTPTKTGEWDIVCAQLCGAGHAKMVATVKVVESEEFDSWYASQNALLPKETN
ncbi:MAG: cytochrome c oxidase subunit II [Verrucomicrobiales bacterium]|nr:cytochrome c oxidase subunit II [Verrucomicrobiales bacterium]